MSCFNTFRTVTSEFLFRVANAPGAFVAVAKNSPGFTRHFDRQFGWAAAHSWKLPFVSWKLPPVSWKLSFASWKLSIVSMKALFSGSCRPLKLSLTGAQFRRNASSHCVLSRCFRLSSPFSAPLPHSLRCSPPLLLLSWIGALWPAGAPGPRSHRAA